MLININLFCISIKNTRLDLPIQCSLLKYLLSSCYVLDCDIIAVNMNKVNLLKDFRYPREKPHRRLAIIITTV